MGCILRKETARKLLNSFLAVVAAGLLLGRIQHMYSTIDAAAGHIDEKYWMHSTYFYRLFFQQKDLFNPDWYTFLSYDQPPVGKYILGFALQANNRKTADTSAGLINWHREHIRAGFRKPLSELFDDYGLDRDRRMLAYSNFILAQTKNPVHSTPLTFQDYQVGRKTVFVFAVSAAALLVIIGSCVFKDLFAGMLAGLVFLSNKLAMPGFQQVLIDSICCFFVLAALGILLLLFRELSIREGPHKRVIMLAVLDGLLLSLAVGTKFITAYMAGAVAVVFTAGILLEAATSRKTQNGFPARRIALRAGIFAVISAAAVCFFVLLNPFLYPDPAGNALKMAGHRLMLMEIQSRVQLPAIHSFLERAETIYRGGILLRYNFHNPVWEFLYVSVFIAGAAVLTKRSMRELSAGLMGGYTIVFLWVMTTFTVNGFMINMQWERYCLPFAMCTALIFALGAGRLIRIPGRFCP